MPTPREVNQAQHEVARACHHLAYIRDLLRRNGDTSDNDIRDILDAGLSDIVSELNDRAGSSLGSGS